MGGVGPFTTKKYVTGGYTWAGARWIVRCGDDYDDYGDYDDDDGDLLRNRLDSPPTPVVAGVT